MFSKNYTSFQEWLIGQAIDSDYKQRIVRMHNLYPDASLTQLRGHARKGEIPISEKKSVPAYKRSWKSLTPREKQVREKSLSALSDSRRNGKSLSKAAREKGISIDTVLKNTNAFKKIGNRWTPKTYDKVSRAMWIKSNGREVSIEVNDSRTASLIGKYHNAVKKYIETRDSKHLEKFKGKTVKDAQGNKHVLETDPEAIDKISESIEEPEFYDIYKS